MSSKLKLCQCRHLDCGSQTDTNPITNIKVKGMYIPRTTWKVHQELDLNEQTHKLAKLTLLKAISVDSSKGQQGVEKSPKDQNFTSESSISSLPPHDLMHTIQAQELLHLIQIINHRINSFTPPRSLQFQNSPSVDSPYIPQVTFTLPINQGKHALNPACHVDAAMMIGFESWLLEALECLKEVKCGEAKDLLELQTTCVQKVKETLYYLDDIKRKEWEQQQTNMKDTKPLGNNEKDCDGVISVNTRTSLTNE